MLKIINNIKIDESDITKVRLIESSEVSIQKYQNMLILKGKTSSDFLDTYDIVLDKPILSYKYEITKYALTVKGIEIEAFAPLPPTITIAVCDIPDWHYVESDKMLLIVAPLGTTEKDLVKYFRGKLTWYNITGGSSLELGNIISFHLSEEVDKNDYDFYGNYIKHFNQRAVIDVGLVTKALNDLIRKTFPDYDVTPTNNQRRIDKKDYIVYTFMNTDNWRRPYIDRLRHDTLLSQFTVQYEFVTFDTVKHQNLLHHVKAVEVLTNIGKFYATDEEGHSWKCAIDWGQIDFPFSTGQTKGNYGENAGNSFTITGVVRYFTVPRNDEVFSVIKYITKLISIK